MGADDIEIEIALSPGLHQTDVERLTGILQRAGFKVAIGGTIESEIGIPQLWIDLVLDRGVTLGRLAISLEDGISSLWQVAYERGTALPALTLEILRPGRAATIFVIPPGARKAVHDLHVEFSQASAPEGQRFWNEDTGWAAPGEPETSWPAAEGFDSNRFSFNVKASYSARIARTSPPFKLTGLVQEALPRRKG